MPVLLNIKGDDGAAGAAGADGSIWRHGTGAPSNGLGANGDFYLNDANGDVYMKSSGTYSMAANIKGATGATGSAGSTGSAGPAGPAPTYASVIANSPGGPPVAGWACQDASMASAIAATYGSVALDVLTGISRSTTTPLYPGAVSASVGGASGDKAKSSSIPTGISGKHGSYTLECWGYVPAGVKKGMLLAVGKDTIQYEGFGFWVGDDAYTTNVNTDNFAGLWKPGVFNGPGTSGAGGFNAFYSQNENAVRSRIGTAGRWHHYALVLPAGQDVKMFFYVNGQRFFGDTSTDSNHVAFTSACRAALFNEPTSVSATPSAGLKVAHAYIYDYTLMESDILARIQAVNILNTV